MQNPRTISAVFILLFLFPLMSMAQGPPISPPGGGGPPTATVSVDCDAGDSVNGALNNPAIDLTIEISGICEEDVIIERSKVTLRGTDPLLDGIRPAPDDVLDQAVNVFNTHEVVLENLSFSDANVGFAINNSVFVTFNNCRIENNVAVGLIVGGSAVVTLVDTLFVDNERTAVLISNGGSLSCFSCTVENNRDGFQVRLGSELNISGSTVEVTRRAIDARGGSRIASFGGNTFEGSTAAIRLRGTSSVDLFNDALNGVLDLRQKSITSLFNTTQTVSSGSNRIRSDSSVVAAGSTSLEGDYNISEFSKVVLPGGTSSAGSLNCSSGADAYCDADPFGGGGGTSNCGQCPFP